ncbi:hypothetical protein LINPERPRIM_LOCUS263, partial [Linum perenne]
VLLSLSALCLSMVAAGAATASPPSHVTSDDNAILLLFRTSELDLVVVTPRRRLPIP